MFVFIDRQQTGISAAEAGTRPGFCKCCLGPGDFVNNARVSSPLIGFCECNDVIFVQSLVRRSTVINDDTKKGQAKRVTKFHQSPRSLCFLDHKNRSRSRLDQYIIQRNILDLTNSIHWNSKEAWLTTTNK